jgi:hypothetical protein
MTQSFIEQLARLHPSYSRKSFETAGMFRQVYLTPAYGWEFVCGCANARIKFPIGLKGRDHWLFPAYMMRLNPSDFHNPVVEEAFLISRDPIKSRALKALLIAGLEKPIDEHLRLVAEKTGFAKRVVEAFEILFFNVLDRSRDGAYISEIVYPDTRLVEFDEDYCDNTPTEDLLLRAAFNSRDIDLVLRLAGTSEAAYKKELAAMRDQEAKLESCIMGNALLMVQTGLINQPAIGLQRATKLLTVGGCQPNVPNQLESQKPYDMAGELAAALASLPPITDADRANLYATARPGKSYWSDENGIVSSFDAPEAATDSTKTGDSPAGQTTWFPEALRALWKNKYHDVPVILIAIMSQPGLADHYLTDNKTGIPAAEVVFDS